ncbi:unnamed protein product [Blepharisma stoltei]|uniref:Uncharacterized protein n=1 Tax=Blepharisma stoltei TaxID=1481888 RepID=A0AAU9IHC6_9CILI|nr:unnamed protein product [Blepharisma stoltei]
MTSQTTPSIMIIFEAGSSLSKLPLKWRTVPPSIEPAKYPWFKTEGSIEIPEIYCPLTPSVPSTEISKAWNSKAIIIIFINHYLFAEIFQQTPIKKFKRD